jgi:hypothetical protein
MAEIVAVDVDDPSSVDMAVHVLGNGHDLGHDLGLTAVRYGALAIQPPPRTWSSS